MTDHEDEGEDERRGGRRPAVMFIGGDRTTGGGIATANFETMRACERAKEQIEEAMIEQRNTKTSHTIVCVPAR